MASTVVVAVQMHGHIRTVRRKIQLVDKTV